MDKEQYWSIIETAKDNVMKWSHKQKIPIYRIDYAATFEEWDNSIGIFVFFKNEQQRIMSDTTGFNKIIKKYYKAVLGELNYPFEKYPHLIFTFSSDENVEKYYEGSYFKRQDN